MREPCAIKSCPNLTDKRLCEDHQTQEPQGYTKTVRGTTTSPRERGYDRRWDKVSLRYRKKHPLCEDCKSRGETSPADLVHHIQPISAGGAKYDPDNLRALCWACHGRAHSRRPMGRADVTLVCGPSGSGKTTWAEEHMSWGDLIVDLDYIWQALTGLEMHEKPEHMLGLVLDVRDLLLDKLRYPVSVDRAWVVAQAPKASEREKLERDLGSRTVVLEVPPEVCKQRLKRDETRGERLDTYLGLVDEWWEKYTRRDEDEVVRPERVA